MDKFLRLFLSSIIPVFIIASCQNKSQEISLEEAQQLSARLFETEFHEEKRYPLQGSPTAMMLLDSILKLDSTNAAAWRMISIPYLKRGMPHKWKSLFDKAVRHNPEVWQPWRGYLYLWFYRDYEKAIADFNASDTLTPYIDYPQGHSVDYWRGIAYLGLKDYPKSIAFFDKHILKETEDSGEDWVELEAFLYRGIAHYEMGEFQKAITDFEKIKVYFKYSAETKYYWAKCLLGLDKKDQARQLLDEAQLDYEKELRLSHDYVEMPYQIYLSDITDLKSSLFH